MASGWRGTGPPNYPREQPPRRSAVDGDRGWSVWQVVLVLALALLVLGLLVLGVRYVYFGHLLYSPGASTSTSAPAARGLVASPLRPLVDPRRWGETGDVVLFDNDGMPLPGMNGAMRRAISRSPWSHCGVLVVDEQTREPYVWEMYAPGDREPLLTADAPGTLSTSLGRPRLVPLVPRARLYGGRCAVVRLEPPLRDLVAGGDRAELVRRFERVAAGQAQCVLTYTPGVILWVLYLCSVDIGGGRVPLERAWATRRRLMPPNATMCCELVSSLYWQLGLWASSCSPALPSGFGWHRADRGSQRGSEHGSEHGAERLGEASHGSWPRQHPLLFLPHNFAEPGHMGPARVVPPQLLKL